MPCFDAEAAEDSRVASEQLTIIKAKLHVLTDMMCRLGWAVEDRKQIDKDIIDWWADHKLNDYKRRHQS